MSAIMPYQFGDQAVRIEDRGGQPWFALADICRVLDIANVGSAAARLDADEKDVIPLTDSIGRVQDATVVNESGMYRLVVRSRKASARRFTKWVTSEVLPAIRRTGGYGRQSPPVDVDDNATLRALLLGKIDRLDEMRPKVDAFDRLTDARGSLNVTEAAKVLKTTRDDLFRYLHSIGWIYRGQASGRWQCHSDKERAGVLEQRTTRIPSHHGPDKVTSTVMVTPKGLGRLAEKMGARTV